MTDDLSPQQEIRIAVRFNTTNVPGDPRLRPNRIAEDCATSILSRSFNNVDDFIHWPPDFDSPNPKSIWVLFDFNIRERLLSVEEVPVRWWTVTYDQQQEPKFKECHMNGHSFTNRLPWGGRDIDWENRLLQREAKELPREV